MVNGAARYDDNDGVRPGDAAEVFPALRGQSILLTGFLCFNLGFSGDLVTFDNSRLLHGRKSYVSGPDRARHLEGVYLDWDEVMSRLRILRESVHAGARGDRPL